MARKPRMYLPGGVYHVIPQGNAGQDIFSTRDDRWYFERLVEERVKRFGHRVHAYC